MAPAVALYTANDAWAASTTPASTYYVEVTRKTAHTQFDAFDQDSDLVDLQAAAGMFVAEEVATSDDWQDLVAYLVNSGYDVPAPTPSPQTYIYERRPNGWVSRTCKTAYAIAPTINGASYEVTAHSRFYFT